MVMELTWRFRIQRVCSVEDDLRCARKAVMEAVEVLRKVDDRDAEDLKQCIVVCGVWG